MGLGAGLFLQGNGVFTLAPGAGQTQTISDVITDQAGVGGVGKDSGGWALVKNGAGTTFLTGDNAYSFGSFINAGVLQGNATSLPGNIFDNASLVFNQAGDGTHTGFIGGFGSLTKTGSGTLTQNGEVTYLGITIVNGGVLLLTSPLTASSGITLNGGALGATGAMTVAQAVTIGPAAGSGFFSPRGIDFLVSGVVSGDQLTKSGPGDVTLSGANAFTGANINGGVLRFNTAANLGNAAGDIVINGGSVGSTVNTPAGTTIGRDLVLLGNGGIDVPQSSLNWSGSISGSGQFIKSGVGELDLTGLSIYSGGTNIVGGTLGISSDSQLGKSGTAVALNSGTLRASGSFTSARPITLGASGGAFNIDNAQTLTLNGPITGSGALTKEGAGTLALGLVSNGYSNTFVNGGTLLGNSSSIRGNLTFGGVSGDPIPRSVVFNQSFVGRSRVDFPVFSGNISGDGSLVLSSGSLILSGTNSYTGGTTVQSGTLSGNSTSLQGEIVNSGLVNFFQDVDGTYAGDLTGGGALDKFGVGRLSTPGNIQVGDVIDVSGGELSVEGTMGSPTVFVNDSGTLTVNGKMTSDTVSVNVGGAMGVNGNLTSPLVTINPGGELQGHGNITGFVDDKGGEIAPGNSIGTLHIFGLLEMEPHSEYQVQINGNSSDKIQVSETATIESSTFEIERYNTASSPVLPGKTYTILTTTGGLTVEAPTLAIADFPFINFTLSEDGFNGYLTTSRSAERFAELASTPNEAAVANALDTATSSLAWQQVVGASTADARAAFSSLSNASIHASAAGVLSEQSHFLRDAVLDRLRQDFPMSDAPAAADSVLSYVGGAPAAAAALPTKKAPAAAPSLGPVYAVWAQGLGSWGSLSGNSNVARTNDSIGGVISGVDVTYNRMLRLGFAGGYSRSNFNSTNVPASGSSDSYHFALYGGWQGEPWALRGGGSFSWNALNTSRQVTVVALGGAQNGSYADRRGKASSRAPAISLLARPLWSPSPTSPMCMSEEASASRVSRR
jgi:outer membrane autotransporter protein